MRSFLKINTAPNDNIRGRRTASSISGYYPQDIIDFYGFSESTSAGSGKTIAIVNAFNNPNAEADLAVFTKTFNLPSCTTANGCFKQVDQDGGSQFVNSNDGTWRYSVLISIFTL
jgi:hypothetical protein